MSTRRSLEKLLTFVVLFLSVIPPGAGAGEGDRPAGNSFTSARDGFDRRVDEWLRPRALAGGRVKVKAGGQSRYRFEYRDDFTLNDSAYEDDPVHLLRNRLFLDVTRVSGAGEIPVRLFAEGQEAHSFARSDVNQTNAFVNQLDLRQLFAEVRDPWKKNPLTVKAGRQVLAYGDERFVGGFDWSNVSRVFDAVKLVYLPDPRFQADVFMSRPVRVKKGNPDTTPHSDNFYGAYGSLKVFRDHVLDMFLFIRHNTDVVPGERSAEAGPLKEYTLGNRFKGKYLNLDYGTEYAVQLGSRSHDTIAAWALHQELGYTFPKAFWTPRLYGEFNHASGDRNPSDGKSHTFDNLYPTNHNKYGFIDLIGLRNINDFMAGVSVKPHVRLSLSADFHWFLLDAKESPWFSAGGAVFRPANPAASRQLGEEIDFLAAYKFSEHLSLMAGYSRFFAGPFAKDTGARDDANFLYLQTVFNI